MNVVPSDFGEGDGTPRGGSQPPLLASPLLAPAAGQGFTGRVGRGKMGERNWTGTPRPRLPGCGTNQFSPNFFLAQSGAGSDKEFHSRRSGARLNAAQTHPTPPEPESQPEPNYPPPSRSVAPRGQPDAPKAGGCLSPTDRSSVAGRPLSLCPGEVGAGPLNSDLIVPLRAGLGPSLRQVFGQLPRASRPDSCRATEGAMLSSALGGWCVSVQPTDSVP